MASPILVVAVFNEDDGCNFCSHNRSKNNMNFFQIKSDHPNRRVVTAICEECAEELTLQLDARNDE